MKAEQFTIHMNRIEVQWLHRQLMSSRMMAEKQLEQFKGPLSEDKAKKHDEAKAYAEELKRLEDMMFTRLEQGNMERLHISQVKEDLEEALELNPYATVEIRKRLDDLPKEEPYRITFDRETAKFTLKLIENDLTKFRLHVIPGYEKKPESDFKDPIQSKEYWINKAHKAKKILDSLKIKLEKEL